MAIFAQSQTGERSSYLSKVVFALGCAFTISASIVALNRTTPMSMLSTQTAQSDLGLLIPGLRQQAFILAFDDGNQSVRVDSIGVSPGRGEHFVLWSRSDQGPPRFLGAFENDTSIALPQDGSIGSNNEFLISLEQSSATPDAPQGQILVSGTAISIF